jgi:hypothetical protein
MVGNWPAILRHLKAKMVFEGSGSSQSRVGKSKKSFRNKHGSPPTTGAISFIRYFEIS